MKNLSSKKLFKNKCNKFFSNRNFFSTTTKTLQQQKSKKSIVFSGIQPTGIMHLGNYLGSVQNWVNYQNQNDQIKENEKKRDLFFCIVDLHALTNQKKSSDITNNTLDMTICLMACGIDPSKCILYNQSRY